MNSPRDKDILAVSPAVEHDIQPNENGYYSDGYGVYFDKESAVRFRYLKDICIGVTDISELSPQQLAYYHLAVAAFQLNGSDVNLDVVMQKEVEATIAKTHSDLIVSAADAITKELLPWAGGHTTFYDTLANDPRVLAVGSSDKLYERYGTYLGRPELAELFNAVEFKGIFEKIGPAPIAMLWAARQALRENIHDPKQTLDIAGDIITIANTIFTVIREQEVEKGMYGTEFGYGYEEEKKSGWLEFTEYTNQLMQVMQDEPTALGRQIVPANILIGAVHDSQESILHRFSLDPYKSVAFIDALDASRGTYEDLVRVAGYRGILIQPYLEGKKRSINALASGRPIPDNIVRFRQ